MSQTRPENQAFEALVRARSGPNDWPEPETTDLYHALKRGALAITAQVLGRREPELAAEIATKTLLNLRKFKGHSLFSTWFFRLARNTLSNVLRSDGQLAEVALDDTLEAPLLVFKGLPKLPPGLDATDRQLVELLSEGFNLSEIGKVFGVSRQAVDKRWVKLREKLREFYGDRDD